jgi:hypothetical protein
MLFSSLPYGALFSIFSSYQNEFLVPQAKSGELYLKMWTLKSLDIMKIDNNEKAIIKLTIIAGVLLSTLQFFYNRSLWLDEAYLALNIINKSHFELLKPLDLRQVAPILFLIIEKIFSDLIPNSEFGLRLFPLISFWLSIFLFYKLIKAIQQNYYAIIFSLSLFVFNTTLIYYSSEVKQYMTDALVLISVYYLILRKCMTKYM